MRAELGEAPDACEGHGDDGGPGEGAEQEDALELVEAKPQEGTCANELAEEEESAES